MVIGEKKGRVVGGRSRAKSAGAEVEVLAGAGAEVEVLAGAGAEVEVLAGAGAEEAADLTSPGPTTGGTMPLFPGSDPELRCVVTRTSDRVVVRFSKSIAEWSLRKRQTKLACRLIDAQAGELRSNKVGDVDDLEADLDLGAEILNDGATVVVRFTKATREWTLHKRGAQLATGLIRARARPLPSDVTN